MINWTVAQRCIVLLRGKNLAFRLKMQVQSLEAQRDDSGPCHLLELVAFFQVQSQCSILEQFMLPSADRFHGVSDFLFQQDIATTHWITVLDFPVNPTEDLCGTVQRKTCCRLLSPHHRPTASLTHCTDAVTYAQ